MYDCTSDQYYVAAICYAMQNVYKAATWRKVSRLKMLTKHIRQLQA